MPQKVALDQISYEGIFYKGPGLDVKDVIQRAKKYGYDAVELQARRPKFSPLDFDAKACKEIKGFADSQDIKIACVGCTNNFASPIMEERENELLKVREQLKMANVMDVKLVRIFAAFMGTVTRLDGFGTLEGSRTSWNYPANLEQKWKWVVGCLKEAAKWAEEYGIVLALQTHAPVVRLGYSDTLEMIRQIGSENVKMSLDVGLGCFDAFSQETEEYIAEAVKACKDVVVHSHWNGRLKEISNGNVEQIPIDIPGITPHGGVILRYDIFVRELEKIGYDGYHSFEMCSLELDRSYNVQDIDFIENQCRLAPKYVKKLINDANK